MPLRLRSLRRLVVLALPCWLLGGPLAGTLQAIAACPHHEMMPQGAGHHSTAPCWCGDMAGTAIPDVPTPPALPALSAQVSPAPAVALSVSAAPQLAPDSPSFPPTPPPPNGDR